QSFPPDKISFSRIRDFKGLENEAIIVVGLPPPAENPEFHTEHYVAMSRAKALLSIIYIK
ncbi:MAG: nuclease, partial [Gammaproteobacteria bacterium]